MDPIIIVSGLYKLVFALVAVQLLFWTLRRLDKGLGISFGAVLEELKQGDGIPIAIYFGARIVAVALLLGMALG